ncbi:hypothetical protein BDZ91DRAFT_733605 [Kalaharituber pfeilii]|nr:hypothetical protein BDZ91DRAFT_733605 [Kalaharituber pfeilii]
MYGLYLYLSRCRCKRMPLVAPLEGRQGAGLCAVQLRRTAHILHSFRVCNITPIRFRRQPTMNW